MFASAKEALIAAPHGEDNVDEHDDTMFESYVSDIDGRNC